MSIQKNFVVHNGLEVNQDLILANHITNKVGILTNSPKYSLHVNGGIGATDLKVLGISTLNQVVLNQTVSAGSTTGTYGQYLTSTGTGVTWTTIPNSRVVTSFIADPGQVTFYVNYNVGALDVFINGIRLSESEFIAIDGLSITLDTACFGGESLDFVTYKSLNAQGIQGISVSNNGTIVGYALSTTLLNFTGAGVTVAGVGVAATVTITSVSASLDALDNFFVGDGSGTSNISGQNNISIGCYSGACNSSGSNNIFFGFNSGFNNDSGTDNMFFGQCAGYCNTTGFGNNFIGKCSGCNNTTGCCNNFIGGDSGRNNTTGCYNSFYGTSSGNENGVGNYNSFFGAYSGYRNTTGNLNTFLGFYVGQSTSTSNKVLIGSALAGTGVAFDAPDITKDIQFAVGVKTDSNPAKYWLVGNENFDVGIGTTNPASKLHIVGSGSTSLLVDGDARITGILTVGTSSITLDGINDVVKIGNVILGDASGNANYTGIVTATAFIGDGSALTNLPGATSSFQWANNSSGIHTLSNVGVGVSVFSTKLAVGSATTDTSVWMITYGNVGINSATYQYFSAAIFDDSGNIYATGSNRDGSNNYYPYIIKLDSNGNLIWQKFFEDSLPYTVSNASCEGIDIDLSTGDIYIAILSNIDDYNFNKLTVLKLNSSGDIVWQTQRIYVSSITELKLDTDNNIYISGECIGAGNYDGYLIKFDSDGNELWQKRIANTNNSYDDQGTYGIGIDSLNNVYITGLDSFYFDRELFIIKFDSDGNTLWKRIVSGTNDEYGYSCDVDSNDNLYVVGHTNSEGQGDYDLLLMKFDSDGNEIWQRILGGISYDTGYSIKIDINDDIYVLGQQNADDILIAKFNISGDLIYQKSLSSYYEGSDFNYDFWWGHKFIDLRDDNLLISGFYRYFNSFENYDGFIAKLKKDTLTGDYGNYFTIQNSNLVVGISTLSVGISTVTVGVSSLTISTSGIITSTNPLSFNTNINYKIPYSVEIDGALKINSLDISDGFFYINKLPIHKSSAKLNNFIVGVGAGNSNVNGSHNNFFGSCAGYSNINGCYNNFFGSCAGYCNISGENNNFLGECAGYYNTTGYYNNFFGYKSGCNNTTGNKNVIIGDWTYGPTTGVGNFIGGYAAGYSGMTDSSYNNFIGWYAGGYGDQGNSYCNNFIGYYAGGCNCNSFSNNFFGSCAGYLNTGGCYNNFFGTYSGSCSLSGCYNNFIGYKAGCKHDGFNNNFFGSGAGVGVQGRITGITVSGSTSLISEANNTYNNVSVSGGTGSGATFDVSRDANGDVNIVSILLKGLNYSIGDILTIDGFNVGGSSGTDDITLTVNSIINSNGSDNNFFGSCAGSCNITGCNNNFLGRLAGYNNINGNNNNFFGYYAGCQSTGNNNIFIGHCAGMCNTIGCENIIIGYNRTNSPFFDGSNQLVIGAGSTDWIVGDSSYNIGIGTTNPTSKLSVVGDVNVVGVVTATEGFTSGIGVTDPVKITVSGNILTFTVTGVGSTSLVLY